MFARCLLVPLVAALADPSIVTTPLGPVHGIVGDSFRLFEGVPYAAPPVGPLRWERPQPVAAWGPTPYDATKEPNGCMQVCTDDEPPHICPTVISEDCLYMNVWTPLPSGDPVPVGDTGLPVMMFFHGGNFHDGYVGGLDTKGGLLYDGRAFANSTNQILVSVNYRLGAFGFLFLGEGSPIGGNFGLMDQIAAMQFVRANIAAWGGDPLRITLMGQSAGSMSISCHLSKPENAGLFTGAIMMSNPLGEAYRDPTSATELAAVMSNLTGCPDSLANVTLVNECMRAADSATLLVAQHASETVLGPDLGNLLQIVVAWGPTIGTKYLPLRPLEAFQAGNVLDVPIMLGTTANESVIFVYEALTFPLTPILFDLAVAVLIGPENAIASTAPDLYPLPVPALTDYRVFASTLLTDGLFKCAVRNATEALAVAQPYRRSKTFLYEYDHQESWSSTMWSSNYTACWTEVCHGSDLPEWFHPSPKTLNVSYTPEEDALAVDMQAYFAAFAATGDPGSGTPSRTLQWPAYDATTRTTYVFQAAPSGSGGSVTGSYLGQALRSVQCNWWDTSVGYSVY